MNYKKTTLAEKKFSALRRIRSFATVQPAESIPRVAGLAGSSYQSSTDVSSGNTSLSLSVTLRRKCSDDFQGTDIDWLNHRRSLRRGRLAPIKDQSRKVPLRLLAP
jgi:hypothetical protein